MNQTALSFRIRLDTPPEILYAEVHKYPSQNEVVQLTTHNWGLDFYCSTGKLTFPDSNVSMVFNPGDIGITGPNTRIRVEDEDDRDSIYFAFKLPDTNREKTGIVLPSLMSVGERFGFLQIMALNAVRSWSVHPVRTRALLWAILWEVARNHDIGEDLPGKMHPAVREVMEIIELEMMEHIDLASLADRVDLASSTLSRLFHRQAGITFVAYLRRRRTQRAAFLLEHTDMPVKEIAYRTGITDPHVFNKTFRKEMNLSPTAYRQEKSKFGRIKNQPKKA